MAKIKVTNPKQIINGGAKKYYFKVKGVGGIKGDKGDKGDTGSQGPQGPQGNAATIEVGSTTTLPTGYDATVTNTGTINNAILNFGIPRGIKGDTGAKGDKGDKGDKGEQGNTGPQGPAGQNATVYVGTTTTGAPGTQASVYNSGTDRNATLNFTIPRGATGPQGPAGQDGQNFTPTIVETLPTTGDQSKLYLTPKNYTTGTATGNPITISLGEDAGQITSFKLDGDTYQQTYTGKNLMAITRTAETKNGVTCTWDGASFTLNGTSTASIDFYGRGGWGATSDPIALPAGTYTMSLRKSDGSLATDANFSADCYYGTTHIIGIYRGQSGAGYQTLTLDSDTQYSVFYLSLMSGKTYNNEKFYIQLEKSDLPTTYEPYVGGIPVPNPGYPQAIQTVTGTQTVEVVGKNLFDKNDVVNGIPSATDGTIVSTTSIGRTSRFIRVKSSTSYSHTGHPNGWATIAWYKADKSFISRTDNATTTTSPTEAAFARVSCASTNLNTCQFEEGQPTTYAPYSVQTLPLNLGSIELCKLGTYQDYIYKSGNDWKVHKAMAKTTLNGSEDWYNAAGNAPFGLAIDGALITTSDSNPPLVYCDKFYPVAQAASWSSYESLISTNNVNSSTKTIRIRYTAMANLSDFQAWLGTHNTTLYYVLATATDTTITDQTLIAQLEAVRNAALQASNTITNSATGTNLAGDMELGYCEYDPTNRYDKWLWLDLNNAYEKIGS